MNPLGVRWSEKYTLMLVGAFDPDTLLALNRTAGARLPNRHYLELLYGHGSILSTCGQGLIAQFLADPAQVTNFSCIKKGEKTWALSE